LSLSSSIHEWNLLECCALREETRQELGLIAETRAFDVKMHHMGVFDLIVVERARVIAPSHMEVALSSYPAQPRASTI
jgi:hypothetical protein